MSACEKCVVVHHIGESTTAKTGTVSEAQCLAPLWNYLLLGYIVYLFGGIVVWYTLKTYREWKVEEGGGTSVASTSASSNEEGQRQELSFFQFLKGYFSDLLLRHPELTSAKIFIGRMFMVIDIGSDVLLVTSLFANQAGESDKLAVCASCLDVVLVVI